MAAGLLKKLLDCSIQLWEAARCNARTIVTEQEKAECRMQVEAAVAGIPGKWGESCSRGRSPSRSGGVQARKASGDVPPATARAGTSQRNVPATGWRGKCSLLYLDQMGEMFAYVRLCSLMFAYVRLIGKKMFEAEGVDQEQTRSNQIRPTPIKSDQINQIKGTRRGREAVGGTPTAAGETPALPKAWGSPAQGQPGSIKPN